MEIEEVKPEDRLGSNYTRHNVFEKLAYYSDFYESLSFLIMGRISLGTKAIVNLDTYAFSSIKGTIDSIRDILLKGRINDSYSLLRKYFDSTMINIYTNLYLKDHISLENFIVTHIDNWRKGTERLPEYRVISSYINNSQKLKPLKDLLNKDNRYKLIRNRCNDHTHYNFYRHMLLNDNEIYNPNRIKYLDAFALDIEDIFIQHFAYIFYLEDTYMMSSDYFDYLDVGLTPVDNSQYWVAGFIQDIFDKIIKIKRPDIADLMKNNTLMELK